MRALFSVRAGAGLGRRIARGSARAGTPGNRSATQAGMARRVMAAVGGFARGTVRPLGVQSKGGGGAAAAAAGGGGAAAAPVARPPAPTFDLPEEAPMGTRGAGTAAGRAVAGRVNSPKSSKAAAFSWESAVSAASHTWSAGAVEGT